MSHQEPQQLGVILVAVAHAVLVPLPLVLFHHLDKKDKCFIRRCEIMEEGAQKGVLVLCENLGIYYNMDEDD